MDPYFYEVVGKVMHFEGTFHSMFPKVKKAFKGGYKCYPTICFHDVVELDSQLPFRQHVNILVKPDFSIDCYTITDSLLEIEFVLMPRSFITTQRRLIKDTIIEKSL